MMDGMGPALELIEAGFAVEVADAPLLHDGLNLADLAHVLMLRERGVIPDSAGRRLLGLLLKARATPAEAFPYDPPSVRPTTAGSASSPSGWGVMRAGCTRAGRGGRRSGWRCACSAP